MDTSILKYQAFVTTVESGSFSRAAELLSYSQSGISRMIGDLEGEWHVSLLERGKSGVKLTSDGTKLLPYARSLIREYENLRHAIDGLAGLEAGLIRIGCHYGLARKKPAELIAGFSKLYPGVDYEVRWGSYGDIEGWLRSGEIDLGFTALPVSGGLESHFLMQEQLMAVYKSDHPESGGVFPIADFNEEDFVLFEADGLDDVSQLLRKCKVSPRQRAVSGDPMEVLALVAAGLGSAVLPEGALEQLPEGIYAAPLDVPAFVNTGIALRSSRLASVAVKKFLEIAMGG